MHRRTFFLALASLATSSNAAYANDSFFKRLFGRVKKQARSGNLQPINDGSLGGLSLLDADRGLRTALNIGIDAVVAQLGAPGGFFDDGKIQIPLPKTLRKARKLAKPMGMAGPFDNLQERMNRGAEAAMPKGKAILKQAVTSMSVEDAIGIVRGPDDSATQYLRRTMEPSLITAFSPVIRSTLDNSGALSAGSTLAEKYAMGKYADKAGDKLTQHVVKGALKGSFFYLAEQERAIRANPGDFGSQLLRRVFG
jgi:hypothetical protein